VKRPSLSSGIERFLERLGADAAVGLGKPLTVAALAQIDGDQRVDCVRHRAGRDRGPDDRAKGRVLVGAAADGDLIKLLAALVEAEDADVADMVMATGVDAAGDLDAQLADLLLALEIRQALGDALGDGNGAGVGERAIVEAGAGDDVAREADVGGCQPGAREREVRLPDGEWVDLWRDRVLTGGRSHTLPAPLEEIPILVRPGARTLNGISPRS
jgi:hypothetical protein